MTIGKLLAAAATLALSASIVFAAATTQSNSPQAKSTSSAKAEMHHLMGTISSVNSSDLVVSHKYDGKVENTTFIVNSATKKEGSLAKGKEATVFYQINNKQNVATDVKVTTANKS
jgi:hypothetical protein